MCHGEGIDDGQFAPPLKGPAHAAYWSGKTAEDMLNYTSANMPPNQPGGLGNGIPGDHQGAILEPELAEISAYGGQRRLSGIHKCRVGGIS